MKNTFSPLALLALLAAAGCKEKQLTIPDLSSGDRRVLVEELTGVKCSGCPDGSIELQSLAATYGEDKLIIISIHAAGNFSVPFSDSRYDLRTAEGTDLANFLGAPLAYPTAAIDRAEVNGNAFLLPQQWPGTVASEFSEDYHVGLYLQNEYDPISRQLHIEVNVAPENKLDGDNRLSIFITQDSIVDVQQVNLVKVQNYTHRHVLRDIVTKFDGDPIGALSGGEAYNYAYDVALPNDWEARHCSVIAFVHRGGAPDREILQAIEQHVVD